MTAPPSDSILDDTITGEVVRNALAVAVEEASIVVVKSAHSIFIQEGADACAALLDPAGQLVAQSVATSLIHGSSLRCSLPNLIEDHPIATMRPRDVFVMNDPFRGGIHANDIIIFRPIFDGDEVVYFSGTLIHVADLGGVSAGGLAALATDTFAEGMVVPPVRLYDQGVLVEDLARILARNSRAPREVMGDVNALVAGANVAATRVEELLVRYGAARVRRFVDASLDDTERRMRDELRLIADGTYLGEFTIDSDGIDPGRTFDVRVAATVADGTITLDFAGTTSQSRGSINSSFSQTVSGIVFAVRCFVDPTIPMNEGCFRPIVIDLPFGCIANPEPPAACGGRVVTVSAVIESILRALSRARPGHAVASSGLVHVMTMAGLDPKHRWLTMLYEFGGIGARRGSDGPDATGAFFLGGRSTIPQIEPLEAQFPIVVERAGLRRDSGGPGEWRGGLGTELSIEVLGDTVLTARGDRMALPPPGLDGGMSGGGGTNVVRRAAPPGGLPEVEQLAPKQMGVPMRAGDVFTLATSGGGGLGDPHRRAVELVAADVDDGRVSVESAERDYGVVLRDGRVDVEATAALRASGGSASGDTGGGR